MRTISCRVLLKTGVMIGALSVCPGFLLGQDNLHPAPGVLAADPAAAVAALADSVRDLQAQVQALHSQMNELQADQQRSSAESYALRRELEAARVELASRGGAPVQGSSYGSPAERSPATDGQSLSALAAAGPQAAPETISSERVSRLEEDLQLTDSKVSDQYQTKVESGSKYRVRLSGLVLMNLFENRGNTDNMDFPQFAIPHDGFDSANSFGGSLRQSQIGLEVFGPTVAGARTSANIMFDFAGGFQDAPNGATLGLVRLRTGVVRLDWAKTSIIAGQDSLFFAPLAPTSIASAALPPLSYAGNLWAWAPQVRVEHRITLSENSSLLLQGGILDSFTGDFPDETSRYPSWGEESNQPAYAARVAWSFRALGQDMTVGAGGYYGRQYWSFNRNLDGWAATADLMMPLGKRFDFSGAFYRGRAINGIGGGIGQGLLFKGDYADPMTAVHGLDSIGGWAQLKFKATPKLEFNGALGIDNPFASEIRQSGGTPFYTSQWMTKNVSPFVNFIYHAKSNVMFSIEYRRLQTFTLDSGSNTAGYVNATVGYLF